jgi:hypothetical protein
VFGFRAPGWDWCGQWRGVWGNGAELPQGVVAVGDGTFDGRGPLTGLGRWWRGVHTLRKAGVILGLLGAIAALALSFFHGGEWPAEKQNLFVRYNDALVADDLGVAYSLGCSVDRAEVSIKEFAALYQSAVNPLGRLTGWSRLQGGPGWIGATKSTNAMPRIEKSVAITAFVSAEVPSAHHSEPACTVNLANASLERFQ